VRLGMGTGRIYSGFEMERMMKAMAKKITWWQAAAVIGVTDRTMRRGAKSPSCRTPPNP